MLRAPHIVCLLLAFSLCLSNAAAIGATPPEDGMKAAREILDRRFDARISLTYNCSYQPPTALLSSCQVHWSFKETAIMPKATDLKSTATVTPAGQLTGNQKRYI